MQEKTLHAVLENSLGLKDVRIPRLPVVYYDGSYWGLKGSNVVYVGRFELPFLEPVDKKRAHSAAEGSILIEEFT